VETNPAQYQPSTSATATGTALRDDETEDGWKKVEKTRKGLEREGREAEKRRASRPRLIKLGAGGVCVAVSIGGSGDARPRKARKPKKRRKNAVRAALCSVLHSPPPVRGYELDWAGPRSPSTHEDHDWQLVEC
jgi:hypothetical protein